MASARQSLGADPVSKASLLQALDPEGALTADLGQAQTLRRGGGAPSGREHLTLDHASKLAAVQDAKSCLAQEETRLHELKRQVAAGVPVDPKRLGFQEHEVSQAWAVLTEAEKRLDAAELQQERVAQATSNNAARARQDAGLRAVAARQLQVDEVHRSTRIVESDLDARAEAQERRRLESEEQQRRAGEAKFHRTLGKRRLKEAQDTRNVAKIEGELIRDDKFSHDAQRVLNLKSSIEKINNNMQASNESRKKKQQKKDAENERRKNDLLEQGLNPYEVFRREDIEADKQRQVRETEERNALRSEKLLEQLMEDDKRYKRKIKQEKQKRMHDEEFQRQMGNYARERRVVAYIKEMTIGNVEVLDPTGAALRIDPSKVTVQRTHAFGLGKVSIDEIKKVGRDVKTGHAVLERHRQRLARISGQESDEDEPAAAADAGAKLSEAAALMQDEDEEALPEGKLWVPKLTELEKQYLAAARERQKQNMTSVQRCWGKECFAFLFVSHCFTCVHNSGVCVEAMPSRKVLILGAGGKTGSITLKRMLALPQEFEVLAAARTEASAKSLQDSLGAKTVVCDLTKPNSAENAMKGIDVLVVLSSATPKPNYFKLIGLMCKKLCCLPVQMGSAFGYKKGGYPKDVDWEGGKAAIDAAKRAGVKHVIYVGSMGGTLPDHFLNQIGGGNILLYKRKAEKYLVASGLPYTIIHPGGLLPHFGNKVVPGGERELLVGVNDTMMENSTKERCIPREDVAEVVVQCALAPSDYKKKVFDLASKDPSLGGTPWNKDLNSLLKSIDGQVYDYSKPAHPILDNQ
eukprot:TRINITY_DN5519_c0_g1_i4.p1 TRINITY_DN5519_c0_g1~~TRINITY_DN5519_c0_g1_i4.p1  ORF type:complete len:825 (+),score=208.90 TRINITY_DN5519_c0_g1_i4:58-2475(+)